MPNLSPIDLASPSSPAPPRRLAPLQSPGAAAASSEIEAMSIRIKSHYPVALMVLVGILLWWPASAWSAMPELRLTTAYTTFSDAHLLAAAWYVRPLSWTRADRTEVVFGAIASSEATRPFVSIGPVWRLNGTDRPFFVEFAFSPTALGGSTVGDRDLGGNLHFTSSLAIGRTFGPRQSRRIAVRIQHLSNGGLNETNPGLDTLGLSFGGSFGEQ